MPSNDRSDKWGGGYIRYKELGGRRHTKTFYVYNKIKGGLYAVSTGCDNEPGARTQWERFQIDWEGYTPNPDATPDLMPQGPAPLCLFQQLDAYLRYCARDDDQRAANSSDWIATKKRILIWWEKRLVNDDGEPFDLRQIDRRTIVEWLKERDSHGQPTGKMPQTA